MMRRFGVLLSLVVMAGFYVGANRNPGKQMPGMKTYDSPVYTIYTDVPEDDAKEAVLRMTKMAFEYNERTKGLFTGQIRSKLPFYLFNKREDYITASGMPDTAGVFTGTELMACTMRNRETGEMSRMTWHTVQHEGFHQFVDAVIRGDIPTWVNEGLAEYFGEGIFTGDSMVIGLVPNSRMVRIKEEISENKFMTIPTMMKLSHKEWNANLDVINYDQAWSMVHFLVHAENGKYTTAFAQFLQLVGKGNPWERAWLASFGSVEGFEAKWKTYWKDMPENPTLDLFAKANVSALTSFLGRSVSQKDTFDSFEEFMKKDGKSIRTAPADWLPPHLFDEMKKMSAALQDVGAKYELTRVVNSNLRGLTCTMEDGTKITSSFTLKDGRIGIVSVKLIPTTTATTPSTPKAKK